MTKTVIWIVAVAGLLPVALLSVGYLISAVSFARLPKDPSERGAVSFLGDVSIQIGSSSAKLHLSTHPWPAVVALAGVIAVVVGLHFLLPRQPDRVGNNGFLKMESYMNRLVSSRKEHAAVIMATLDGQRALLVMRQSGQTTLNISVDRTKNDVQEAKMREFFRKLGMTPERDYRSANGGVEDATCNLEFVLPDNPKNIASLCVTVFSDLFGVTDRNGLEFTTYGL